VRVQISDTQETSFKIEVDVKLSVGDIIANVKSDLKKLQIKVSDEYLA
jgi:hypothetical protein